MTHDILIVDDEEDICLQISGILKDEGYSTRIAHDAESAFAEIAKRQPDLVILDIWLQGSRLNGLQILKESLHNHPNMMAVMISGHGTIETAVEAIQVGAYDFIEKPFKSDRLILVTQRALEASQLRRENQELRLVAGPSFELLGETAEISAIRDTLHKVAGANSRVLLYGPAGCGKETAARYMHSLSPRSKGRFVVLNCATLEPEHFEEELFGLETRKDGEISRKMGVFELAHKGTLYLDEVSDMPLPIQGKITRVLQEQCFKRVGGNSLINTDVRVVASTTRDLKREIEDGLFREELFYRLNVVPIVIPSLKSRAADIPLLVEHLMNSVSSNVRLSPKRFTEEALLSLKSYSWPGNVRQLRNVIEWVMIMNPQEREITPQMLPPEVLSESPKILQWDSGDEINALPLREAREVFEREYMLAQIAKFGGNISKTADFIGMERSALHRKLKLLSIPPRTKFKEVG